MAFAIPQTLGKAPSSLGSFKTLWMINCRFPYRLSCRKHIYWTPVCNLITSVKNEKVKLVRALANTSYRRTSKKIVCEGLRLVSDALKRGLKPDFILYSDDVFQSASFRHYFSEQLFATPVAWKTTHDIMASLSDSVTCQVSRIWTSFLLSSQRRNRASLQFLNNLATICLLSRTW